MSQVLTPDQLVAELRSLSARISRGVAEVHNLDLDLKTLTREYDWAKARAMLAAEGTVEAKKAQVELAVMAERVSFDIGDAAFNYAKGLLKSLESTQMSTMAQLRAVDSTYRSVGRE